MNTVFKKIFAILLVAGLWSTSISVAQTGPVIIPRNPNDASINEGVTGRGSAGFKTNVNPLIGNLPASYFPFHGLGTAIGSLVMPGGVFAPSPLNPTTYGFKPLVQQVFPYKYSEKGGASRLFAGTKGIGGKNVTDVGLPGIVGGSGPGDLYWVGFPRPANPQQLPPPVFQQPANSLDCFCRFNETVYCPVGGPLLYIAYGGTLFPLNLSPHSCQACFGPGNIGFNAIVKHDIYVGTDHGTHWGYPTSFPADPGYQQCLRENQGDPSGGAPGNLDYGL